MGTNNGVRKVVYLDTETTGITVGQIAQIAYIVEENGQIVKTVMRYLEVDFMEEGATKVNGLTVEGLKGLSGGLRFKDIASELYEDLSGAIVMGHNIGFDEKFVSAEMARVGISYMFNKYACSMEYFRPIMMIKMGGRGKGKYKNPKLSEVMEYLGISDGDVARVATTLFNGYEVGKHDARFDSTAVYLINKSVENARQSGCFA